MTTYNAIPDGALRHMLRTIVDKRSQLYLRLNAELARRKAQSLLRIVA